MTYYEQARSAVLLFKHSNEGLRAHRGFEECANSNISNMTMLVGLDYGDPGRLNVRKQTSLDLDNITCGTDFTAYNSDFHMVYSDNLIP